MFNSRAGQQADVLTQNLNESAYSDFAQNESNYFIEDEF